MTTIAQNIAAKATVAFVAAAMIISMFAPAAQAQTTEDLQKMINDLMAQIAALQGQGNTMSPASGICPYTWTRSLSSGATGADVMKLQQFLNSNADTRVSATGAGSVGAETEYYGPATAAAVSKFQVMHRADILTPNGLVNPTGYFGPSSINKANTLCVSSPTPTTPGDEDEDEDEDDEDVELSGEADLDTFEVDDADDTDVQEGDEEVEIGVFTVEFTDGDAEISRLDIGLDLTGGNPWDAFETISLWVDGDMIAEVDADDEDDYLDEDDGTLRFSNLGLIAMEEEEMEIVVAATIQNNLDTDELGDWDLTVWSLRYFDADGVATTENTFQDIENDGTGAAATFTIEEAGEGEELKFSLGSDNPDATDIVVDETNTTDGVTILEYTIEAEEGDIELDTLFVNVVTSGTTSSIVSDIELVIDGQTFKDESVANGTVVVSTTSTRYKFDIDGDITIDEDDEVTIEVVVDFKKQTGNYSNGATIMAQVTSTERALTVAEGADDLASGDYSGTAVGKTHTLVAEGIVVPVDGVVTTTDTQGENDTIGKYTIEFEVTAVEGDFYIAESATEGTTATSGVEFTVDGGTATSSGVLASTADEDTSGVFTVREGETETFTLTVTVDPAATGQFRVTLTGVNYTDETDGTTDTTLYTPTPAQDFRTGYETIQGS